MLKQFVLIAALLSSISSCGFHPMHQGNSAYKLGKLTMHNIHSANNAYAIEKSLFKEMSCTNCEYTVDIDVTKLKTSLVTQNDSTNIRSKIDLKLTYKVYDKKSKMAVPKLAF